MPDQPALAFAIDKHLHVHITDAANGTLLGEVRGMMFDERADLLGGPIEETAISAAMPVEGPFGAGERVEASILFHAAERRTLRLEVAVDRFERYPEALFLFYAIENHGPVPVTMQRLCMPRLQYGGWLADAPERPWTFQGAAVTWGQDFAFPLPDRWERDNFLGHLDNAEGGGIPLAYCWNPRMGLALAHVEPRPADLYLPVTSGPNGTFASLEYREKTVLRPGESMQSGRAMISLHHGDFYEPLALYARVMADLGIRPAEPNAEDYEPAWCSWGYEEDVLPGEIVATLPKCQELGIHWITLDDRWFDHYGDHNPRADTFPGGEDEMRDLVDAIHDAGGLAQIWWYPLAVENGDGVYGNLTYGVSAILREHPDWLILNPDGSMARNNRGLGMLCPALPGVQDYLRETTLRFIRDWDFDGHKLDNIYTVPACHNPAHQHEYPQESTWALAEAYRIIFETTRELKPYSVTQICPCGTPPTFSLLPYMDQSVTADPTNSLQVRQRIKFYKALLGPRAPVFADHVELADGGIDFASGIGPGGIPATKFVWPEVDAVRDRLEEYWPLTPERETLWREWLDLYRRYRLAEGEYMNLYDLGFDIPEAHAIRKDGRMFYAFFTPQLGMGYHGPVTLRGLEPGRYRVHDYVAGRDLGAIEGPEGRLDVRFEGFLLVEAVPEH